MHLVPTANVLALHIPKGVRCRGKLMVRDQALPFDSSWAATEARHANWETLDFDDRAWRSLSSAIAAERRRDVYLRKLLLRSASRTYPRFPDDTLFMTAGGTYRQSSGNESRGMT